ncbi:MAG: hypothetical protein WBE26_08695 [Phycisphaerae bacterium]
MNTKVQPSIALTAFVIVGFHLTPAFGDSLSATSLKHKYCLFEPIVLNVTLHFTEPFVRVQDDPVDAARQQRRLTRKLTAELRSGDVKLCEAFLSGGQFDGVVDRGHQFHATVYGCLGTEVHGKPQSQFLFWDRPGKYVLVVRDQDNRLESNEISLEIIEPSDSKAAELFASGGLDTLSLLLIQKYGQDMITVFETLGNDYPQTVYGRYASTCLVLRRFETTRQAHAPKDDIELWSSLARDLEKAVGLFPPSHPVRNRTLLALGYVQRARGFRTVAEETIMQLLTETTDGSFVRMAKQFSGDLKRMRTERGNAAPE